MERILNEDEKIRKAEEIYFRRNNKNISYENKENLKSKKYIKNKILLELLVMIDIAIIVFCVQNRNFIFTKEFLDTVNQYNINISEKILEITKKTLGNEDNVNEQEIIKEEKINENNVQNETIQEENTIQEQSSSISEMQLDIENLKAAYSFIKPVEGVVTSIFGARESEYQNISGYHTGIDIAAEKNTYIKASMGGIVTLVSNEGDYGKHLKIRCNNVTTLYAHCSKIFVKEGQIVAQGQDIGPGGVPL